MILFHHVEGISDSAAATNGDRVVDHAVFSTFDSVDLTGLLGDRHILVDNTDAAFTCYGNSQGCLGDGVHSGRHKGYVQRNVAGKSGGKVHFARKHFRISRNKEDIIECQSVHFYSISNK